jgi:trimeric autotransporter adhesin
VAVQRLSNSGRSGFSYKSLIAGITPLPSVPTIGAATAVNFESVNVAFTAPGAYAGSTFTATSSPGGFTGTSATSPILVTGLSESTAYTFTVTATNATGTSGASAASDPVTTPSDDTGVMYPIQMVSVGAAGAAYVEFTSIPQTYKHLEIRSIAKNTESASYGETILASFNGDTTTTNYRFHYLYGSGSSASAGSVQASGWIGASVGSACGNTPTSVFAAGVSTILDYASTSKNKVVRTLGGHDMNGTSGELTFASGLWLNQNPITSIRLTCLGGFNFTQYSQFALYGIKGV